MVHAVIHDFLPTFAMAAGVMAVIWLVCAIITIAGSRVGGFLILAVQTLVRVCIRAMRRRRAAEYAQLVMVDSDGITAIPVNLRRTGRWRCPAAPSDTQATEAGGARMDRAVTRLGHPPGQQSNRANDVRPNPTGREVRPLTMKTPELPDDQQPDPCPCRSGGTDGCLLAAGRRAA